jgi:hypothetical protein
MIHRHGSLEPTHSSLFRAAATRAELVASQSVIEHVRRVRELIHEDFHAAELRILRREELEARTHHGIEHEFSAYNTWHERRDAMRNALRRDLGLEAVRLEHLEPRAVE